MRNLKVRFLANKDRENPAPTPVAIDSKQLRELTSRLDAVVRLLALNLPADMKQETKVRLLSDSGFQPKDIAKILDTTPNAVSVALSKMRRRERTEQETTEGDVAAQKETGPPQEPVKEPQGESGPQP